MSDVSHDSPVALTKGQRSIWLIQAANQDCAAYNVMLPVFVDGSLDLQAVENAVGELVDRHPALMSRITYVQGDPHYVRDEALAPVVVDVDLFSPEREGAMSEFHAYATLEGRRPFSLEDEAPCRVSLVRGPDFHVLVFWLHHVITDGSSAQVILDDFIRSYDSLVTGRIYVADERDAFDVVDVEDETSLDEWQTYLAGAPVETTYPRTRPRGERFSFQGERLTAELPGVVTRRLHRFARARRVTPFTCLVTAVAVVIGVASGQRDLVLGVTVSKRSVHGRVRAMGYEAALVPVRVALDIPSLGSTVDQVARSLAKSYGMASTSFDSIVETLGVQTSPSFNPVSQVVCNSVTPLPPFRIGGQDAEVLYVHNGSSKFDLTVDLWVGPGKAEVVLEYCSTLYTKAEAEAILSEIVTFLTDGVANPDAVWT
ncbi:condensation domain-containing protein [Streptomyces sp. NPDC015350]|uniref:condensation domain-containing protein n=1 Tax=Streptomyces sp. NPDC015350 TaxID=3364955 RepID=UPI0036FC03D4